MAEHVCTFVEEQEPSGRLVVGPCLECGTPAMEVLARGRVAERVEYDIEEVHGLLLTLLAMVAAAYRGGVGTVVEEPADTERSTT